MPLLFARCSALDHQRKITTGRNERKEVIAMLSTRQACQIRSDLLVRYKLPVAEVGIPLWTVAIVA